MSSIVCNSLRAYFPHSPGDGLNVTFNHPRALQASKRSITPITCSRFGLHYSQLFKQAPPARLVVGWFVLDL